ncbi:MAG: chemotaxis protein CheD [Verrucomicrobiota bacterium]
MHLCGLHRSEDRVIVGIAELAVSSNPQVTLMTYSLGSCLGVAIYDPAVRVGGLLHLMLPDSKIDPVKGAARPGMFVDTGIPALFRGAYNLGADKRRLLIYVAGGAQVMDDSGYFSIGKRNYEALTALLNRHGLRICAEQVGGFKNRTLCLNLRSGDVSLRISGQTKEVPLC